MQKLPKISPASRSRQLIDRSNAAMLALLRVELDVVEQFIRLSKQSNDDESHNYSLGRARRLVQPEIARFTRVCSYDRAGYGWSDPGPMPRTSTQIAKELHAVLQNAGEHPPYVLVGHSFGAANVRVYNGLYSSDVVGMVLVDGGPDDLKLPRSIQNLSDADLRRRQRDRRWVRVLYRLGISRILSRKHIENPASSLADQEWWYFDIEPKFVEATTSEVEKLALFDPRGVQEMKDAGTLGDKPLIVLIAGKGMWGLPLVSQDWIDLRKMWVDGQMRLAQQLSSRGKWIVVSDSTHMIPDERPDAIVSAVREVYTAAQEDQQTIDSTVAHRSRPAPGRGPFPGSSSPGHSVGLPIQLQLQIPTPELRRDGTTVVDFIITNVGTEPLKLPSSVAIFDSPMEELNLWITSDAIKDQYAKDVNSGRLFKIGLVPISAELDGHSDECWRRGWDSNSSHRRICWLYMHLRFDRLDQNLVDLPDSVQFPVQKSVKFKP